MTWGNVLIVATTCRLAVAEGGQLKQLVRLQSQFEPRSRPSNPLRPRRRRPFGLEQLKNPFECLLRILSLALIRLSGVPRQSARSRPHAPGPSNTCGKASCCGMPGAAQTRRIPTACVFAVAMGGGTSSAFCLPCPNNVRPPFSTSSARLPHAHLGMPLPFPAGSVRNSDECEGHTQALLGTTRAAPHLHCTAGAECRIVHWGISLERLSWRR